jgi:hypothetical protein
MKGIKLCYLIALILAVALVIIGFMDLLKKREDNESELMLISRQIRGFAMIMLGNVVVVLGGALCYSAGHMGSLAKMM